MDGIQPDLIEIFLEILDEEFYEYLKTAQNLLGQIHRDKDKLIIKEYINRCCRLKKPLLSVKENRNRFFKYFLKMLQSAASNQAPPILKANETIHSTVPKAEVKSSWNEDKTSFVSVKTIPGLGTLVYLASTNRPELGWDIAGFDNIV